MTDWRFNPPPNWPPPPPGWTPPAGWRPPPEWGPHPPGWQLWLPLLPQIRPQPKVESIPAGLVVPSRRLTGLAFAAGAPLPAVITLISVAIFCDLPPVIANLEMAVLPLIGFPLAIWFTLRVVLGSPLNLFGDLAKLVAGAVSGKIPHILVLFLVVQAALFWLAFFLIVKTDPGGCGL